METVIKTGRTHDQVIKYLMDRKNETIADRITFSKSEEFQEIKRKLKELNKK
ncbi:MAG: hypothetical protein RLZZ312_341 [Bacteroidota bacterium]|jgi:hypothetical protein